MSYTKEEKDQILKKYFKLQETGVPVSIRTYAARAGVKYYTFRDWYRDYKAMAGYRDVSAEECSGGQMRKAARGSSADDGFRFIRVGSGMEACGNVSNG